MRLTIAVKVEVDLPLAHLPLFAGYICLLNQEDAPGVGRWCIISQRYGDQRRAFHGEILVAWPES